MIVGEGLGLAAFGVVAGGIAALALTRSLEGPLHGVRPNDPVTIGSMMAFVFVVATCAATLPALRAIRIDPVRALRVD
jgi:ABC-type antimicrobial peptide transport system permease subunit